MRWVLSLILCDFSLDREIRALNKSHIVRLSQQLSRFLKASLDPNFRNKLEETSQGFAVADLISTTWKSIEKVKLIIITNADCRARIDALNVEELDDKHITLSIWDLKRLKKFVEQGQVRADAVIDFKEDFGGGIPLLKASGSMQSLESYLAVIPGKQLAEIYDRWGSRLLESNVRSFLQVRGNVNKGIRDTIRDTPHMFFSYNNGISATADNIEVDTTTHGLILTKAENLQIVNGGQTTASLHAAYKSYREQLDEVYVQIKLTITPRDISEEVVPKISEYANSQNKVNAADFFSNHPFHIRVEELSRRILAPSGDSNYRETKWFYERARGQFADERSKRSHSERRKFDLEFPRKQFFTKTDLAKYQNTWSGLPNIVSLGAQKNFSEFAKRIGTKWGKSNLEFNDVWFKRLVAKAIIFRETEKIVSAADWYEGGYRANIVTYTISKLVKEAQNIDMVIDLDKVWKSQTISSDFREVLSITGELAQKVITSPPEGIRNYSEWAKKPLCWQRLDELELPKHNSFFRIIKGKELAEEEAKEGKANYLLDSTLNDELEVVKLGCEFWRAARNWAKEHGFLTPREISVLEVCAAMPLKIPSSKQCNIALSALKKLQDEGFLTK